jgi:hypothetical protein
MTNRARAIAFLGLVGLFLGSARGQAVLSLISFSMIAWVLLEWFRFQARIRFELPRIRFQRLVNGREEPSGTLWSGRKIHVVVHARSPSMLKSIIQIRDVVPEIAATLPASAENSASELIDAQESPTWMELAWWTSAYAQRWLVRDALSDWPNQGQFELGTTETKIQYAAELLAAGQLTLPGLRLTIRDEYGLFVLHRFHELPQTFRILPKYYEAGELRPTVKRHNSLPRHGIHRLQRAGMGSELLELREYVVGDPPKSIAWKVSARRDKLLTRQYESEVPVRVHLIIDGSVSTRMGGYGRRLLDQINYVAASVAKAAIAVGDPVDGLLIDEAGTKRLPWFSGDRGLLELLKALADFSLRAPPATQTITPYMLQCVLAVCQERYPELLDRRFNWTPMTITGANQKRFRICGVLAEIFQLSAYQQVECMHDDARLSYYMQELLWRAGMPWMAPIFSVTGDPAKAAEQRMQTISQTMVKAIAHAHDNEVFVVFADLLSCAPILGPLARTVKLARAKHHRVAFVCPTTTFIRPKPEIIIPSSLEFDDLLLAAEQTRVRDLATEMKRELTRLGASVSFTGQQSAIQMVIAEMDKACDGRTSNQGVRT